MPPRGPGGSHFSGAPLEIDGRVPRQRTTRSESTEIFSQLSFAGFLLARETETPSLDEGSARRGSSVLSSGNVNALRDRRSS